MPGILCLNLQATSRPGEYTILFSLRADVGKQRAESRHAFRIE